MSTALDFNSFESGVKQKNYITKSDIFRNARVEASFVEAGEKDGKKTDPYFSLEFTAEVDGFESSITHRFYAPPTTPEEVKYVGSKYEKKVKVGEYTKEEQIIEEQKKAVWFFIQLADAVGETNRKDFLNSLVNVCIENNILNFTKFCKMFLGRYNEKIKVARIDFKTVWINSESKKESSLRISDASGSNYAFCKHDPAKASLCCFTPYEQSKSRSPLYHGKSNAPKGTDSIIPETSTAGFTNPNAGSVLPPSGQTGPATAGIADGLF